MADHAGVPSARAVARPLVLIVDDDARATSLLARMLASDGFDTDVALDGPAALARLGREPVPDALLTDYHLPLGDGLTVALHARSRRAGLPVVIVTGDPQSVVRASATSLLGGSVRIITKPLDYGDLVAHLADVLGVAP